VRVVGSHWWDSFQPMKQMSTEDLVGDTFRDPSPSPFISQRLILLVLLVLLVLGFIIIVISLFLSTSAIGFVIAFHSRTFFPSYSIIPLSHYSFILTAHTRILIYSTSNKVDVCATACCCPSHVNFPSWHP
jgi:uncharacterized BrkB/YihY/UPF0761 family membrane protein